MIEAQIEEGVLFVYRNKGSQNAHFIGYSVLPEIWEKKFDFVAIGRRHRHFVRFFGLLAIVRLVIDIHEEFVVGSPFHCRTIDKGAVAAADGVVVHKWQVHAVELIFYNPGIMGFPVIRNSGVLRIFRNIVEEFRDLRRWRLAAIPHPYKAMRFIDWP